MESTVPRIRTSCGLGGTRSCARRRRARFLWRCQATCWPNSAMSVRKSGRSRGARSLRTSSTSWTERNEQPKLTMRV
ncbi:unnamed protein product [Durusdinium trenchii]|uniref:Uncharacterized protein n=1 Tax=Durusdinium trenchii TaxID=1381693 RepID=A0ABP0RWX1_9DINO